MKILIVMDPGILIPVKDYGGIERIIEMLAKNYAALGHEVHLLVTTGSAVQGCTVHNFGKEGFPPNKWDALAAIPVAWKFLKKHRNDFDVQTSRRAVRISFRAALLAGNRPPAAPRIAAKAMPTIMIWGET